MQYLGENWKAWVGPYLYMYCFGKRDAAYYFLRSCSIVHACI